MTEKQIIERLMLKVEDVRKAQRDYFKNRMDVSKRLSIAKENDLDEYVKQLRRQGYTPESQAGSSQQNKIF